MPKYRKKTVIIAAQQWSPDHPHPAVEYPIPGHEKQTIGSCHRYGRIETAEGEMLVHPGDWIVTHPQGGMYPYKNNVFEATYELVED